MQKKSHLFFFFFFFFFFVFFFFAFFFFVFFIFFVFFVFFVFLFIFFFVCVSARGWSTKEVKVVGARGRCGHVHGPHAHTTARMQGNKTGNFFVGPGSVEVFSSHDTNAMKIPRRQLFHSFLCHFMAQEAIS